MLLAGGLDVSTAAPTIGAMVGLGVGIDYALFIVSRYRENRAAGQVNAAGAVRSHGLVRHGRLLRRRHRRRRRWPPWRSPGWASSPPSGSATSIVVLFAVATALTLLPALLSLLGDRIDAGRVVGRRRAAKPAEATAWWRLAHRISARPWPYLVAGVARSC